MATIFLQALWMGCIPWLRFMDMKNKEQEKRFLAQDQCSICT
jgi:hypothetical protein